MPYLKFQVTITSYPHKNSRMSCILTLPLYDQTTVSYKEYSGTTGGIQTPIVRDRSPLPCSVRPQWYKLGAGSETRTHEGFPTAYKTVAIAAMRFQR